MAEREPIEQPTELVYPPSPSWAPAFLGLGITLAVCGIFAEGFMVRGWVWSIVGAVIALAALRGIVAGAVRDFYRLPRRQRVRGAVLPVARLRPPRRG
jgi:hypothetical protein